MSAPTHTGRLAGKVAVVTGGAQGIGQGIVKRFVEEGARVLMTDIQVEKGQATASAIAAEAPDGAGVTFMRADILQPADIEAMVEHAVATYGRLDILVLNASVRKEVRFVDMDFDEWRRILSTSLDGSFHCMKACLPHLIAAGGGNIVTLAGDTALDGAVGKVHSSAAKSGLAGMGRALAKELAQYGIRVNCVSPGAINTSRPAHRTARPDVPPDIPLGRYGKPDEIAATVRFLCGPGGGFMTGQVLHVNGGTLLGN